MTTEAELEINNFKDERRDYKPKIAGDPWKLEADSLLKPSQGTQIYCHCDFSP